MRFLAMAACVVACSNAWSTQLSPNAYSIECSGGPQSCAEEAQDLCPRGYDVLGQTQRPERGAVVSGGMAVPVHRATLVVRCR
jgi:hypothetical protein